ncbi:TrkH family potassium uptake protein [Staphylococcus sp. SQ8-PEA]|uniref:TrkH family potassium uptake protein n=1 Tax=Staphylococcus marylandisciuri TaxID=2981529 RepID=A0ABT2QRA7_9STAP|nr:potassium transporter TrkG [Staphylococcus marylandisciuri]MCU5746511.1 TrkH family potassium uptake protein [Staphylococcus marylandisciuri]
MSKLSKPLYIYFCLFISTTLIGGLLLYLPITGKKSIALIDAFFISSSAFTVTGLTTVDVANQFNALGEIIILILIQIGGLGIVSVTILTLLILNKRITLKNRHLLMVTWNIDKPGGIVKLIIHLVIYSLTTELVGFLCLCLSFVPKFGLGKGTFISLFTSVSAFNNAGFALFSDNLLGYASDPVVTLIVPILIIMGGIGHFVFIDFITCKRLNKLALHSKVVLATTAILIIFGTVTFFIFEQNNTLSHMSIIEKIGASFFQSVTTRTAGFNTVDIGEIHTASAMAMMLLMFIGGAPLSAAGGIKVTTFALLTVFVVGTLRNSVYPSLFNKTISDKLLKIGTTITLLSSTFVLMVTFIITSIHPSYPFIKVLFEVVSAFGTVGLTMDFTTEYDSVVKLMVIIVMLSGKVGLLTLMHLFIKEKRHDTFKYAKGTIHL